MNKIRLKISILFFAVVIIYLLKLVFFKTDIEDIPDIQNNKFVYDNCSIIDQGNIFKINKMSNNLKKETGVSLIIVTVETVGKIDPDIFTEEIMSNSNYKNNNEKVLLFFSKKEGFITIKYDISLEYILNKDICSDIIDNYIIKEFKSSKKEIFKNIDNKIPVDIRNNPLIGKIFYDASKKLNDILVKKFLERKEISAKIQKYSSNNNKNTNDFYLIKIIVLFFVLFFIFIFILKIKEMHCPKCHNLLNISIRVIQKATNDRHGLNEKIYRCKTCGYIKKKKNIIFPRKYRYFFKKRNRTT